MNSSCFLGNHALTGHRIRVPIEDMACHWHVMGRTGRGKTKALEIMCRSVIDSGSALVLLDGKGDLFEGVLHYCIEQCYDENRVAVIDPTNDKWAVGLNYLQPQAKADPATHAARVMDGMKKIFGESGDFKPFLEKWLPATALPLIMSGLTVAEMERFASIEDPSMRKALLYFLKEDRLKKRWQELDALRKFEAAMQTAVVQNRAILITDSPMGEAMFSQTETKIDWLRVIDTGGIVLIRCHEAANVSHRLRQSIGVTVIHQIMEAAMSRSRDFRPNAWVVCDEFQEFACEDFARSLAQMRSFQVWFVLANQYLAQLEEIFGLIDSIQTNCDGKLYFSISHKDGQEVVDELYADYIHGDHVKHITEQTKFRPVETTRTIRTKLWSRTESSSDSFMNISSSGSVVAAGHASGETFIPGGMLGPEQVALSSSDSSMSSTSSSTGTSSGSAHGTATTRGGGEAIVPFYKFHEFMEETGRQFYTLEEIRQRCMVWIMQQSPRKATLKLGDGKAIPIVTRYCERPNIDERLELPAFLQRVLPPIAMPVHKAIAASRKREAEIVWKYKEAVEAELAQRELEALEEKRPELGKPSKEPTLSTETLKKASTWSTKAPSKL